VSEIAQWLGSLGMSEYAQRFSENDIDLSGLSRLTDRDLREFGVVLEHRRRMLAAIGELARATPQPSTAADRHPRDYAELRQLTVMLCDFTGSAALSGSLDPEDLLSVIGAYHRCCAELIEHHGGFVANYMSDGVLACFGYPRAGEHDAERAVRAGLALAAAVPKLRTAAGAPLQARVGIATGLVVVGALIGAGAAQEEALVGETPNLAARLQALAEPGAVVISSSTRKLTGGLFDYRDLGAVALKGFAENVPAWQALGASGAENRFKALRATTTPLVGREEEIELLLRRWERAKAGEGSVVLISGEAGIGKSRLAETIFERLRGEPHTRLRYFCSPHHQDSALHPNIMQLERAAGLRRGDTDAQRLAKLEAVLALASDEPGEALPLLADLLSIPTAGRHRPLSLTPQRRKEKTLNALLAQIEGLARRRPLLMLFEDVHWSDPTTREMLGMLIDRVPALRVLAIITFRPEFAPAWLDRPQVTLLGINRLPPRQSAAMIARVAGDKLLPREIAVEIADRTDGVPLFIEELTKAVIESGLLAAPGDRSAATGPPGAPTIPTSLQASLLARLDRLAPTREVAQIAAALGRRFSHELISAVAAMPRHRLDEALAQLVDAELIFRRGTPPEAEYTFKHALVQDAAYGTLLRGRRQHLHARIAATLEEQFPAIAAAQPAVLGRHCAEAGLSEKAAAYWLKAGQQAMARSAMTEAVAQLRKGLDALTGLPDGTRRRQQELDLHMALRPALAATKGWSAAEVGETVARARVLAEQIERPEYLVPLLYGQWAFHAARSERKLALSLAEQIIEIGEARNDIAVQLQGRRISGLTHLLVGEFVAARALLEQCHGLAEPAHRAIRGSLSEDLYSGMLAYLAVTLAHLGHVDQARARAEEALAEARRLKEAHSLAVVLHFGSWSAWVTRSPKLQQHAEELLALSAEHGFPYFRGWATAFRGWSLATLGQAREGRALVAEGLAAVRATGAVFNTQLALLMLAEIHALLGEPGEGLKCLAEAEQTIETTDERIGEAELHRLRGDLLNDAGGSSAAERSYRQALAVARRQSAKLAELRASIRLARLWLGQGKRGEARELLAAIHGWFSEGFDAPDLREATALLAELAP